MLRTEVAELIKVPGFTYDLAEKVQYKRVLTNEEKEATQVMDAFVRDLAENNDPQREIAALVKKTIQEENYDHDELLEAMFDIGSIGEFDDVEIAKYGKNTLIVHEAAKGGNVDRSYLDVSVLRPTWRNAQVETDLSYADMRRNGFKSVANLTTYMNEALRNHRFKTIFEMIDAAITGGEQVIAVTGKNPTVEAMDQLALYLTDRDASNAMTVSLTKYAQQIARMEGYSDFMSNDMKNEFNRYGLVNFYSGVRIAAVPAAHKMGDGSLMIPDRRIFGVAGKIGTLDQRGDVHVYENADNNNEVLHIKVSDYTYGVAITDIDNVAKITFTE